MIARLMGSGGEFGIPELGCECNTCKSTDPRNKRERSSLFLTTTDDHTIIIDAGCDFRDQVLRRNLRQISAMLLTDDQYYHIMGVDEVRPFTENNDLLVFVNEKTNETMLKMYNYVFHVFQIGGGVPQIKLMLVNGEFTVDDVKITPIECSNQIRKSFGYRIGNFAYLPECKTIESSELNKLKGIEKLVIAASGILKREDKLNIDEAIEYIVQIGSKNNYISHLTHEKTHSEYEKYVEERKKSDARLANIDITIGYDGLEIDGIFA